jgi:hypothetical protein
MALALAIPQDGNGRVLVGTVGLLQLRGGD